MVVYYYLIIVNLIKRSTMKHPILSSFLITILRVVLTHLMKTFYFPRSFDIMREEKPGLPNL